MLKKIGGKGLTLIELLIVITIISILAAIGIPTYKAQVIKAKITEPSNAARHIATAVNTYCQEITMNGASFAWPNCPDIDTIQSSLGLGLRGIRRINAARIDSTTGAIEITLSNIDTTVDGRILSLIPYMDPNDGAIRWDWGGNLQPRYIPKR